MSKVTNHYVDPFDEVLLAAIENPQKRYEFYRAFLELDLFVIGTVSDENSTKGDDPTLLLKHIEVDGELVLPVYSSLEKFNSIFKSNYNYVQISTRYLLKLIDFDSPWVLNPGFDLSKKIIPEELETLRDGRILHYYFDELSPDEKVQYLTDQITEIDEETMNFITSCLREYSSVKKAYLTNIFNPATGNQPFPLIGLKVEEVTREESKKVMQEVFKKVNKNRTSEQQIEFVILDEILPLTHSLEERNEPFYTRTSIDDLKSMFH
ncbi:enhanced serine sensitivity protein SseB C-terminal domain-containing protein [Fredinandcohnia sp. 179-A 10B2 NHS]|uniref:enhanced serine sensitivity protein SseB C-terminal domain-containing protein n=1 Tax=Fredinandcohnia sp. 179-A 10B2 NHS TaxID=3235176 RepID=UPI0039A0FCD0